MHHDSQKPTPLHSWRPKDMPEKAPVSRVVTHPESVDAGIPTPKFKDKSPQKVTGRGWGRIGAEKPVGPSLPNPTMRWTPWKPKGRKD